MNVPKISCLTITRNRPEMLRRAIDYYARQTWPNKELIVVVDNRGDTDWVEPFFASIGRDDVHHSISVPVEHMGGLRNQTVDRSVGELVATWDDDDLYHPRRLETQAEALLSEESAACFLTDSLEYFTDSQELFFVNWRFIGLAPSMIARRSRLPRYPDRPYDPVLGERGEDSLVQREMLRTQKVTLLGGHAYLYTRVYHGGNVWNQWHHVSNVFELCLEPQALPEKIATLAPRLEEYYPFPVPPYVLAKNSVKVPLPRE